jgi:hypothetical protein
MLAADTEPLDKHISFNTASALKRQFSKCMNDMTFLGWHYDPTLQPDMHVLKSGVGTLAHSYIDVSHPCHIDAVKPYLPRRFPRMITSYSQHTPDD